MNYTLKLDQAALQVIGIALGKMPHVEVAALIAAIQQQIDAQEQAARATNAAGAIAPPADTSLAEKTRAVRRRAGA